MRAILLALTLAAAAVHAQPTFRGASSAFVAGVPAFRAASAKALSPGVKFRAAASASTSTSSLSINRPAGTVADDVLIAAIGVRPMTATISAPSGWTLVRRTDNSVNQGNSLAVFRKVAGASEPSSYAFDVTGVTEAVGGIQAFYNVDTANPVDVENGQATTPASNTHATPSVTTTVAGAMLVTAHTYPTATTWTPPSGMTEGFDSQLSGGAPNSGQSMEGAYVLQASAAASGAKSATAAGGSGAEDYGVTHILALKPAAPVLAVGKPSGLAENDVMIAAIGVRPYTATISTPSGWTLVRRTDNTTNQGNSLAVFRKVAGASESASYAFDVTGATEAVGGIQAFMNVDTATPIDVENGQATSPASNSHATPSVTTTVANALIVTAHTYPTATTWTAPTGMTEGFESQQPDGTPNSGQSIEGAYVLQATAGASGAKTATAAGGSGDEDYGVTHILALKPGTALLAIAKPSGLAQGDVMIAAVGVRPLTTTITAPSGWTLVRRTDNSVNQGNSLAVFRKAAGASEAASYAFGVTGATEAVGGIQAFSGVDSANPIDVENGQATTPASNSLATPSVTTTVANAMLVTAHTYPTATTWTPPSGMTEGFDSQLSGGAPNSGQSIEAAYVLQTSAGASGAKTATAAGGSGGEDYGATHILALRPMSAPSPALYFIHVDHLDTPRLIADSTGATVWTWDQAEPFGNNLPNETAAGFTFEFPLAFPGQYRDKETNLHYNYFRDYDSAIGRYVQSDPIGLRGGINTYLYAKANPINVIDPEGLTGTVVIPRPFVMPRPFTNPFDPAIPLVPDPGGGGGSQQMPCRLIGEVELGEIPDPGGYFPTRRKMICVYLCDGFSFSRVLPLGPAGCPDPLLPNEDDPRVPMAMCKR